MAQLQKITPNLWFDGNAQEAVNFYQTVFKDVKINATAYYPNDGLPDFQKPLAGKVLTIDFELLGCRFIAINAGPDFHFSPAVSFMIECDDQAEIDYYWDALSAVPEAEQCGWLADKFGLSWQVVPANMDAMVTGKPKAFQAMMQMKKLDIAKLEAAANS